MNFDKFIVGLHYLPIFFMLTKFKDDQRSITMLSINYLNLSFCIFNSFYLFINFPTYCYTFTNFLPPGPFYLFIFPLLSTLILLFLYLFIILYFWLFLFLSSYYKFTVLFSVLLIVFSHIKDYFSLSLSNIFHTEKVISLSHFFLYFSFTSILGWWIFVLFVILFWVYVIKFCIFKLLSFFIFFDFMYVFILHYKDKIVYKNIMLFYYITWLG